MTLGGSVEYPPARHMLRDLQVEFEHGEGESRAWIPAPAACADRSGNVRLGVLATLVDALGGGLAALAAAPGWIATADLTVHRLRPVAADGSVVLAALGRVLRSGRTTVVIECRVGTVDRPDPPVAIATMTFAVLDRRGTNPVVVPNAGPPVRNTMALADSHVRVPVLEAFGISSDSPGRATIGLSAYVTNSLGSVQGGALATLAEFAAESLVVTSPATTVELQLDYLSLAKRGPVIATAHDLGDGVARVEIADGDARRTTAAFTRSGVLR
jgi:uncharacterized protein (TIGR00369 family)